MTKEIWKNIPGYENLYQVSNLGLIRSLIRWNGTNNRILQQTSIKDGRWKVILCKNNKKKTYKVHRLVLEAFIGKCPLGMECRHLDGDPGNNVLENLCWGSHSDNEKDKVRHGTKTYPAWFDNIGSKHGMSILKEKDIPDIRNMFKNGFSCIDIAEKYNVSRGCISGIVYKRNWRHI
jgi:hypothetical protein